jgi:hypothetical protein
MLSIIFTKSCQVDKAKTSSTKTFSLHFIIVYTSDEQRFGYYTSIYAYSSGQMVGFKLSYLFTKRHEDEIELMARVIGYMLTSTGWVFVWGLVIVIDSYLNTNPVHYGCGTYVYSRI